MDWDVFISHAWEDKEEVARPLAETLRRKGLRVWYDEFTLTLGDSLRRSIDRGLAQSRYGVVILSPHFFAKEWPQKELDGLAAREVSSGKVILPVWHKVTWKDVRRFSPTLADKLAVSTEKGLDVVVEEILRAFRVDLKPAAVEKAVEPVAVLEEEAVPFWRKVPQWIWGAVGVLVLLAVVGGILLPGRGFTKATPTPAPVAVPPTAYPTYTPSPTYAPLPTDTPTPIPPTPTPVPPTDTPTPSIPLGMVYVPVGEFIMGSTDADVDSALALCNEYRSDCQRSWYDGEQPQHTVYLDAFYIDKTEVTNAQYRACVEAGACDVPAHTNLL